MTRIVFIVVAGVFLLGCVNHPYRTGKLVINKFDTAEYVTNNPLQVKDDSVARISDNLQKSIVRRISKDHRFSHVKGCTDGDYELTGKFERVDSMVESHWRLVLVTVNQKFDVYVSGTLKDCKTGATLVSFAENSDDEDMEEAISSLADDIIGRIEKDRAITLP